METRPRLGMYAAFGFHVPFDERMGLIADAGFDCTSLCWEHKNERARELKLAAPGVEHAGKQGVVVAIENTRSDVHLNALFDHIDSKSLGLCYDISHDVLNSEEPGRLLRDHGSRLISTHFADTDGILDRHWLPRRGCIDYAKMLREFPRGYEGMLMLEVSSRKTDALPEFTRDAIDTLKQCVASRTVST
ncbi:MAG: sugar phosphate isomerase/epimerase [Candidatus Hydrogenedentota bacterium]